MVRGRKNGRQGHSKPSHGLIDLIFITESGDPHSKVAGYALQGLGLSPCNEKRISAITSNATQLETNRPREHRRAGQADQSSRLRPKFYA